MNTTIIRTQDNLFFKVNPETAQAMRSQYLSNDLEVTNVKYFVYLKDKTEEFKNGKAVYFTKANECYYFYLTKIKENQYIYIDYGIEFNNSAYIVEKRIVRENAW